MSASERRLKPSAAREQQLRALAAAKPSAPKAVKPPTTPTKVVAVEPPPLPSPDMKLPAYGYPEPAVDISDVVEAAAATVNEAEKLLEDLRVALKRRTADSEGVSGIQGLARNFRMCDANRNGILDLEEFAKCVAMCKLGLAPATVAKLFAHFDRDHSGSIDYNEFLSAVRGPLPPARRKLVLQAFHALDAQGDGNGVITVEDIAPYYDASKHPDVVSGRMGKSTALMKFLDGFEGSVVTVQEWLSYYEDLSASIDSDDYFGQMMATTWAALKQANGKKPAVSAHVNKKDVDALEKILYEATYKRKGGGLQAQERLINDTFKIFDENCSGSVDKMEFLKAMERFGLHVRGKGRPGVGGLPENVVLALFDRYDVDNSGSLTFREFSSAFLHKLKEVTSGVSIPAAEYTKKHPVYVATFDGEPMDDKSLTRLKAKTDPELMAARMAPGVLSQAALVHGTSAGKKGGSGGGKGGSLGSGKPFLPGGPTRSAH